MAVKEKKTHQEPKFTKEQILDSKKYSNRRDVLVAILDDEKSYTLEQIENLLEKFMKGKVK